MIGKIPPPRIKYKPMSFGGKNIKRGWEKGGTCKRRKKEERKKKMWSKKSEIISK
jgi:hypothetical protein